MFRSRRSNTPQPLAPPASNPPLPQDEFSHLLASAELDGTAGSRLVYAETVRRRFLELDRWILLVREDRPTIGGPPTPVEVLFGNLRAACVFSSTARAAASASRLGLQTAKRPCAALTLPVDHACNQLCGSDRLDAVLFNPDRADWTPVATLAELAANFEERFDRLTPRMFGRFAEAVNRGGSPLRARLIRRLLTAPEWWFVATTARPHAPALIATSNGSLAIPIFTDAERARRGGPAAVEPLNEGNAVPVPGSPRDGASYLRRLHERMRGEIIAAIVNHVPDEPGEPAPLPIDEVLAAAEAIGY